jgi:superkiller protein 3
MEPLHSDATAVASAANGALAGKLCDEAERLLALKTDGNDEAEAGGGMEGNGEAAVTLFRAALDQDPTYARAYHLLGNVLEFQGRFAEAVEAQRLAVQHGEGGSSGSRGGGYAEAHLALGVALEAQQRTAEAVEHYDRAVVLLPQGPSRVDAQLCLADALATHGSLDRAEAAYRAVASVAKGNSLEAAHAAFGLGAVHRKKGVDLAAAVAALRAACGLEPDAARFWCARVDRRTVDEPGLWADASAAFGRAVELQPELWDAVVGLARVRRHQGMKGLAVEKVQAVLAAQPRHPDALAFAGVMAAADGKHGEAIRLFAAALTQEPAHAECLYHMGNSLFDVGRAEEAIAAYRKCLGQEASTASGQAASSLLASDVAHGASYNLGVVLEQQGDRAGATQSYELAAQLASCSNSSSFAEPPISSLPR